MNKFSRTAEKRKVSEPMCKKKFAQLVVRQVAVGDLRPALYNARRHTPEAIGRLKESIARFGLVDPVIANAALKRMNVLVGGHMRLKAAKELGLATVPVVYVNIPDLAKEKELNLRLNRNVGEWDLELLKDFDPTILLDVGFDENDLSGIWDDALEIEDDNFDAEKEISKIKKPRSKTNDLYQMGQHRLLCSDSTDPKAVVRLMAGKKANAILQDPPFNISLDYNGGLGGKRNYGGNVDDAKTDEEYAEFLRRLLRNGLAACAPDAHVFTYCDQRYIWLLQTLYRELGVSNKRVCLWIKNNSSPTPQVAFNKQFEACIYGTVGKPFLSAKALNFTEIMNADVGTGNRTLEDILDMIDLWLVKRVSSDVMEHPTQKPPQLHEKALRRCTRPGDIVLDPCAGSGSLMVACEGLRRSAYMIEREPIFVDLIIRRYEMLSGKKAKKLD